MAAHVGILPIAVLDALSVKLNEKLGSAANTSVRFMRLPHPRTGILALFLSYEASVEAAGPGQHSPRNKTTILEVQTVAPPNARSWFIANDVLADGSLLILTPVDPVFLLAAILQTWTLQEGAMGTFRPLDDIFEEITTRPSEGSRPPRNNLLEASASDILYFASLDCVKAAMKHVCDVKMITSEIVVYRYSQANVIQYLRSKVRRLATQEVIETSRTLIRGLAKDGLMEDGKEDLLEAGRIRVACDLVGQYIPEQTRQALILSYDFKILDNYFKAMEDEAAATLVDSDVKAAASKVKTKESKTGEEKKRKNGTKTSQGVERLKKVNINGMAKMSSFFKKS